MRATTPKFTAEIPRTRTSPSTLWVLQTYLLPELMVNGGLAMPGVRRLGNENEDVQPLCLKGWKARLMFKQMMPTQRGRLMEVSGLGEWQGSSNTRKAQQRIYPNYYFKLIIKDGPGLPPLCLGTAGGSIARAVGRGMAWGSGSHRVNVVEEDHR